LEDRRAEWELLALILRDRYLLLIAGAVMLLTLVNTTGDFIVAQFVNGKAHAIVDKVARPSAPDAGCRRGHYRGGSMKAVGR
jgi:hypothetical protein